MPSVIMLVVYALAVARVTRLITADQITDGPRQRLITRLWRADCGFCHEGTPQERRKNLSLWRSTSDTPLSVYMITCAWCVSIWVSLAATPLIWAFGTRPWLLWPAVALALSHTTGLLAKLGG